MPDNIYREGSKLHGVYAVFLREGIEAAFKYGIDVAGLSPSTLKIQSKKWGGDQPPPKVKATKHLEKTTMPRKDEKCYTLGSHGVRMCIMKTPGEEQSVIRWLDNDQEQAVPNSWLHLAKARVK
jgi:hypothetical protein